MQLSHVLLLLLFVQQILSLSALVCVRHAVPLEHCCSLPLCYFALKRVLARRQAANVETLIPVMKVPSWHLDSANEVRV